MATYTHFGKQADVLKHLVLCEALRNECPHTYVETNSACAIYDIMQTPELDYGIYHFLDKADENNVLKDSLYYKLEKPQVTKGHYLGSPALAMNVLGEQAEKFVFFDLEQSALDNVSRYAMQAGLSTSVQVVNADSQEGVISLLPSLPQGAFLHIDPYEIDKKGTAGFSYLDVLIKATLAGMKCLMWYGYITNDGKEQLEQYITDSLASEDIEDYTCVELTMNVIGKDTVSCNPGVLGSGILATNLSEKSRAMILDYSDMLVDIYSTTKYREVDGKVYRDVVNNL